MTLEELISTQLKLKQEIIDTKQKLTASPSGNLVIRFKNGKYRYSISEKDESNKRHEKYLGKDNMEQASLLADKLYLENKLKDLQNEKAYIDALITHMTYKSSINTMLLKRPGLHRFWDGKDDVPVPSNTNWQYIPYNRSERYPEALRFPTIVKGLYVRSKSEADIVTLLVNNGVPFHYEEIITIGKIEYAMDFICLNTRTEKLWNWDHQGMLDNPNYINKTISNQAAFLNAGFIPWINTIVTTETKDTPLDLQWVDMIIKYYLI